MSPDVDFVVVVVVLVVVVVFSIETLLHLFCPLGGEITLKRFTLYPFILRGEMKMKLNLYLFGQGPLGTG